MNEFEIISKYFVPLTRGVEGCAGLRDDAAVLEIPEGEELVVTSDTLNEGVHFIAETAPELIAKKALRVNLSDLASMGARPYSYQLNLAFPSKPDEGWLAEFSESLMEENEKYDIFCSGGDTTNILGSGLSVSITALGTIPKGKAVRRGGAQDGDALVITNFIGDSVLGLMCIQNKYNPALYPLSMKQYNAPDVRTDLYNTIRGYAHAAADVSDGLLADSMHIASASGLGLEVDVRAIKFSSEVLNAVENGHISYEMAIKGGDDYVLALSVPQKGLEFIVSELKNNNLNPMVIGFFTSNELGLNLVGSDQYRIDDSALGWQHF